MKKDKGQLIGEYIDTYIKLFMNIEAKHKAWEEGRKEDATELAIKEDQLNGHRSALRNAINEEFGDSSFEIKVGRVGKYQK